MKVFNASAIRAIVHTTKIRQSAPFISECVKGRGYEWLFFTRVTVDPLIKLYNVFGAAHTDGRKSECDRWFYHPLYNLGFWAAFKTDEDAIHFKLMGLGVVEPWELP